MPSVQQLAEQAYACFEVANRDAETDPTYVRLRDGSPEWVSALVKAAHGTDPDGSPAFLPDDYRYAWAREACCALSELSDAEAADAEEASFEWASEGADVYTGQLLAWLASHAGRVAYADDGIELVGTAGGVLAIVTAGQVLERQEVFGLVLTALREHAEEMSA